MENEMEIVSKTLNSVLILGKRMTIAEIEKTYKELTYGNIDYQKYGCKDLPEFFNKFMNDQVMISRKAGLVLYSVESHRQVEHMTDLIDRTKSKYNSQRGREDGDSIKLINLLQNQKSSKSHSIGKGDHAGYNYEDMTQSKKNQLKNISSNIVNKSRLAHNLVEKTLPTSFHGSKDTTLHSTKCSEESQNDIMPLLISFRNKEGNPVTSRVVTCANQNNSTIKPGDNIESNVNEMNKMDPRRSSLLSTPPSVPLMRPQNSYDPTILSKYLNPSLPPSKLKMPLPYDGPSAKEESLTENQKMQQLLQQQRNIQQYNVNANSMDNMNQDTLKQFAQQPLNDCQMQMNLIQELLIKNQFNSSTNPQVNTAPTNPQFNTTLSNQQFNNPLPNQKFSFPPPNHQFSSPPPNQQLSNIKIPPQDFNQQKYLESMIQQHYQQKPSLSSSECQQLLTQFTQNQQCQQVLQQLSQQQQHQNPFILNCLQQLAKQQDQIANQLLQTFKNNQFAPSNFQQLFEHQQKASINTMENAQGISSLSNLLAPNTPPSIIPPITSAQNLSSHKFLSSLNNQSLVNSLYNINNLQVSASTYENASVVQHNLPQNHPSTAQMSLNNDPLVTIDHFRNPYANEVKSKDAVGEYKLPLKTDSTDSNKNPHKAAQIDNSNNAAKIYNHFLNRNNNQMENKGNVKQLIDSTANNANKFKPNDVMLSSSMMHSSITSSQATSINKPFDSVNKQDITVHSISSSSQASKCSPQMCTDKQTVDKQSRDNESMRVYNSSISCVYPSETATSTSLQRYNSVPCDTGAPLKNNTDLEVKKKEAINLETLEKVWINKVVSVDVIEAESENYGLFTFFMVGLSDLHIDCDYLSVYLTSKEFHAEFSKERDGVVGGVLYMRQGDRVVNVNRFMISEALSMSVVPVKQVGGGRVKYSRSELFTIRKHHLDQDAELHVTEEDILKDVVREKTKKEDAPTVPMKMASVASVTDQALIWLDFKTLDLTHLKELTSTSSDPAKIITSQMTTKKPVKKQSVQILKEGAVTRLLCCLYGLHDVSWPSGAVEMQKEWLKEGMKVVVQMHGRGLFDSCSVVLVDLRPLEGWIYLTKQLLQSDFRFFYNVASVGELSSGAEVLVTYIKTRSHFSVIPFEYFKKFSVMSKTMQAFYNDEELEEGIETFLGGKKVKKLGEVSLDVDEVEEGSLYAVFYNEDSSWYRGKVISKKCDNYSKEGQFLVYFVDVGHQEWLSASLSKKNFKLLINHFRHLPMLCSEFMLAGSIRSTHTEKELKNMLLFKRFKSYPVTSSDKSCVVLLNSIPSQQSHCLVHYR